MPLHNTAQRFLYNSIGKMLFVGGSGSCGTKMLHGVLNLHPQIFGVKNGESVPAPHYLDAWADNRLPSLLERRRQMGGDKDSWLVDATPDNVLWYESIRQCFDRRLAKVETKYLHLQRDEDETVKSIMRRGVYTWSGTPKCEYAPHARKFVQFANALGAEVVERTGGLLVSYDALLLNPEAETKRICEWLGVEWCEAMIYYGYRPEKAVA